MDTTHKRQYSFAAKLSFYVLLFTILIFLITFWFFYFFTNRTIKQSAEEKAVNLLENTKWQIENVFTAVKTAPSNILWAVVEKDIEPDSLYPLTRRILEHNDIAVGTAVAFEPYYFKDKGYFFSPYSYRDGDKIETIQLGTETYHYFDMDWYQTPKTLDRPYWSDPYYDDGGGQMLMVTYSSPIRDKERKMIGILTIDVELGWLTDLVNSMKPYRSAYTVMIGRDGTYIVHPNKEMILNKTVFALAQERGSAKMAEIGQNMIEGKSGMEEFRDLSPYGHGEESYIFYTPLNSVDWSLGLVILKDDVFAELNATNRTVIAIIITGLALLFVFCMLIIRKLTRPLSKFSASAREIAKGNFNAPLPDIRSRDEMGELRSSFGFMQEHLTDYIEQLKETTSTKERIESELRIARDIQMGMIPKIFPPFPDRDDIDLYASLGPAKEVGGDLYDFFIDSGKLYFAIGDVSGKGVPASLFMAVTRSLFRSIAAFHEDPADIISSMNNSMSETNDSNMFVTFFAGILDLDTGTMRYCNAGHNPPYIISADGQVQMLEVNPNIPAGLFPDFKFVSEVTKIPRETVLFLFTDGLSEAENAAQELYGEERLEEELRKLGTDNPKAITEIIIEAVNRHVDGAEQSDDLTILTIKY